MHQVSTSVLPPPDDNGPAKAPNSAGQPEFVFRFVTGRDEVLEAYETALRRSSNIRPWLRVCLLGLGFMWLAGGLANITGMMESAPLWRAALFAFFGWMIVWRHLFAPIMDRRRIRASVPVSQEFVLKFSEQVIQINQVGNAQYERTWTELVAFASTEEGVLMWFSDGLEHCIPKRAFHLTSQSQAFLSFLRRLVPHAEVKG